MNDPINKDVRFSGIASIILSPLELNGLGITSKIILEL